MTALPSRLSSSIEAQKKRWGKSFVPTCFNNETKQSRSQPTGCPAAALQGVGRPSAGFLY